MRKKRRSASIPHLLTFRVFCTDCQFFYIFGFTLFNANWVEEVYPAGKQSGADLKHGWVWVVEWSKVVGSIGFPVV